MREEEMRKQLMDLSRAITAANAQNVQTARPQPPRSLSWLSVLAFGTALGVAGLAYLFHSSGA